MRRPHVRFAIGAAAGLALVIWGWLSLFGSEGQCTALVVVIIVACIVLGSRL